MCTMNKVEIETDGYTTSFITSLGTIFFHNDLVLETNELSITINEGEVIGVVSDISSIVTLNNLDVFKVKNKIENYLNEHDFFLETKTDYLRELVKMVMRLFPNTEPTP